MRGVTPVNIILPVFCLGAIVGYAIGDIKLGATAGLILGVILAAIGGSEKMVVN